MQLVCLEIFYISSQRVMNGSSIPQFALTNQPILYVYCKENIDVDKIVGDQPYLTLYLF